ncbi:DUF1513 domain-containing protein [Jannaschia sp. CCS1]|uniref:DUF1513 domain-containing protein n=1 Tax=Jannaschia sp. (strain CCS1) TaxID=290400 RepID=UPI000053DAA5|nr:DUF1513 domain-containing protein [Jannaschia sp. CCS1]ABD54288.1 Twin-arginine translocation pathway signal [Jannaschia sp. CCS1]
MNRRDLLVGLGAATLVPKASWADAHNPAFLSAAQAPDGNYHLCGLDPRGDVVFSIPLPGRGHAAAAHPTRPEAVAFARRPGRFALILDCVTGQETARLLPPPNRHFYGHGTFSSDGDVLFTTENDLTTLEGRIGLWDAAHGYVRLGDVPSGGIGPHDIARLPGTETLVIANGGIATHPDSGRTPLNPATMRSNLAYMRTDGTLLERVELDVTLRQNSIRHLSIRDDGLVSAGMQWNGAEGEHPPLTLLHRIGAAPRLLAAPTQTHRQLDGYVGSISFDQAGAHVAVTSPRGGTVHIFDVNSGAFAGLITAEDICGLALSHRAGLIATTGQGITGFVAQDDLTQMRHSSWRWDNHIVAI